jgi:hypothetical protein
MSFEWMQKRVKQDVFSCKEAIQYFKKRAAIEEEYGKAMVKLSQSMQDSTAKMDGKQGCVFYHPPC